MATSSTKPPGIGVVPTGVALTVTLVAAYVVCWLFAAMPGGGETFAHSWLNLFSTRPLGSIAQLVEGGIYSAVSAWFAALIFAPVYNLTARADRII